MRKSKKLHASPSEHKNTKIPPNLMPLFAPFVQKQELVDSEMAITPRALQTRNCGCNHAKTSVKLYRSNFSKNHEKLPRKHCVSTIDCLDYSEELDLIAFGGISGKIGVLDSCTLSFKGLYEAHDCEVMSLNFHDP